MTEGRQKAALRAMLMSTEFHTLGDPQLSGLRPEMTPATPPEPRSYRAMVMLNMNGGADTFNLLVPKCAGLWDEYLEVRTDMALAGHELLDISASTQSCTEFGVHHKLPFVQELYAQGQLAFVSNVGSLVLPTNKTQYYSKGFELCSGLYSHIDQQYSAQTLKCQVSGASPRGFGGRLADALAAEGHLTTSFSLAGSSTFSQGVQTTVDIISPHSGAVRLSGYEQLQAIVGNITKLKYNNVYCDEYVQQLARTVDSTETLGGYLDKVELSTAYQTATSLSQQLHQVSRLMATRSSRHAERDIFFVEIRGFDTHSTNNDVIHEKFEEINGALEGFIRELKGQGIFDSTVLVTSSEFARTLTSNGQGTDHGWAGNHIVLGGSIRGGQIFNRFPESLLPDNPQDAGRGRLIPIYPWENIMAPIAEWMGGAPASMGTVFPNLHRFDASQHIISRDALFVG